jgi:ribosomal protein S18 acetylase RimI-like enzyme
MGAVYAIPAYPKDLTLRDGTTVTVRPLERSDNDALLKFFLAIPESDRYFLKDDVTSPEVIRAWTDGLDYRRALPLVAMSGDQIVAEAVLVRRRGNARSHIGEVRVTVSPEFRNRGLGTALIRELCDIADDAELDKVLFEVVADMEEHAVKAAEQLGFLRTGAIEGGARDQAGHLHDVLIMAMPLGKWYRWTKY